MAKNAPVASLFTLSGSQSARSWASTSARTSWRRQGKLFCFNSPWISSWKRWIWPCNMLIQALTVYIWYMKIYEELWRIIPSVIIQHGEVKSVFWMTHQTSKRVLVVFDILKLHLQPEKNETRRPHGEGTWNHVAKFGYPKTIEFFPWNIPILLKSAWFFRAHVGYIRLRARCHLHRGPQWSFPNGVYGIGWKPHGSSDQRLFRRNHGWQFEVLSSWILYRLSGIVMNYLVREGLKL